MVGNTSVIGSGVLMGPRFCWRLELFQGLLDDGLMRVAVNGNNALSAGGTR